MAESVRRRRVFAEAYKLEAVSTIRGGQSVSQVAAALGLPDRLVRTGLDWGGQPGATAVRRRAAGQRRCLHTRKRRRPAAWARARPTKQQRLLGSGGRTSACAWSATS